MKKSVFYPQANLLLNCLPAVAEEKCFAMKGGTAINMFVKPMPRLSVDIDLTYVPIEDRTTSLANISAALERIAIKIQKSVPGSKINRTQRGGRIVKLVVSTQDASIKIEPNEVLRGTTKPPVTMTLVKEAVDLFEISVKVPIVPIADLYGGKICAALDRQHPRDLFDIKTLLDGEGLTDDIRKGFLVFLISHDRPMHELLSPNLKDISSIFEKEFKEMTSTPLPIEQLLNTRAELIQKIGDSLTEPERDFLIGVKQGKPNWELLGVNGVEQLPAIQWKLQNIGRMDSERAKLQFKKLEKVLGR